MRTECEREALKLTRNRHDAEEIAQEAMTRAWCKRHTCRTPDSPRAWVRQIARNEALRAMRRRPGETLVDDVALLAEDVAAPAESMDAFATKLDVRRALATLPEEDRVLVELRYGADLAQPQIAQLLAIAEGTTKVRLHRIRQRLRAELKDENEGPDESQRSEPGSDR